MAEVVSHVVPAEGQHGHGIAADHADPCGDACIYEGTAAPKDKAPPPSKAPRELPGEEYETATPPPPEPSIDTTPIEEPPPPDSNAVEATPPLVPEEIAPVPPAAENEVTTSPPPTEPLL